MIKPLRIVRSRMAKQRRRYEQIEGGLRQQKQLILPPRTVGTGKPTQ